MRKMEKGGFLEKSYKILLIGIGYITKAITHKQLKENHLVNRWGHITNLEYSKLSWKRRTNLEGIGL